MSRRLPVFATLADGLGGLRRQPPALWLMAGLVAMAQVAVFAARDALFGAGVVLRFGTSLFPRELPQGHADAAYLAYNIGAPLLVWALLLPVVASAQRRILLGEAGRVGWAYRREEALVLRGLAVLAGLVAVVLMVAFWIALVTMMIGHLTGGLSSASPVLKASVVWVALIGTIRLWPCYLILPAAAIGRKLRVREAMAAVKGAWWSYVAIVALAVMPVSVLGLLLARLLTRAGAPLLGEAAQGLCALAGLVLLGAVLAAAWRRLVAAEAAWPTAFHWRRRILTVTLGALAATVALGVVDFRHGGLAGLSRLAGGRFAPPPLAQSGATPAEMARDLEKRAGQGEVEAQYRAGVMYQLGQAGHEVDLRVAAMYYKLAADHGYAPAQLRLGLLLRDGGDGVVKDPERALLLLTLAAGQGDATAEATLGRMYATGGGVPKDVSQALGLYRRAAEHGDGWSAAELGFYYETGIDGVARDPAQAARYYQSAAAHGSGWGQVKVGLMYQGGTDGLPRDQAKALGLFDAAVQGGQANALGLLGHVYADGLAGVAKDPEQALRLYQRAAGQGDLWSILRLAEMYSYGQGGLPFDAAAALRLFRQAADQGSAEGQCDLGWLYERGGLGLGKDEARAAALYRQAADHGFAMAEDLLGLLFQNGRGDLPKDEAQALALFRRAADRGLGKAMYDIGFLYDYGLAGLTQDPAAARAWYQKAAAAGYLPAQTFLKTVPGAP
jgi:TPR repeat protein